MTALFYVGIVLLFAFFVAWFVRNVLKYMYRKQWVWFNRAIWWILLPISLLGLVLVVVGAAVV